MNNIKYCEKTSKDFLYEISKCKSNKNCIKKIYVKYNYFIKKCINNKIYNIN